VLCYTYREYELEDSTVVDVGGYSLSISKLSQSIYRLSLRYGDAEVPLGYLGLSSSRSVELVPYSPVGGRVSVRYLMVRFRESIAIPPGGSLSTVVQVPVDIGIYVGGTLVRVVPTRVKYALYGPPDMGELCRYVSEALVNGLHRCLRAPLRVSLSNASRSTVNVSRVVVPLGGLGLYLNEERAPVLTSVRVSVRSQTYAEVVTELTPSEEGGGFTKLVVPPSQESYAMIYGV